MLITTKLKMYEFLFQKLEECFPSTKPDDYIIRKPIAEVPVAQDEISVINHNPYGGYIG